MPFRSLRVQAVCGRFQQHGNGNSRNTDKIGNALNATDTPTALLGHNCGRHVAIRADHAGSVGRRHRCHRRHRRHPWRPRSVFRRARGRSIDVGRRGVLAQRWRLHHGHLRTRRVGLEDGERVGVPTLHRARHAIPTALHHWPTGFVPAEDLEAALDPIIRVEPWHKGLSTDA